MYKHISGNILIKISGKKLFKGTKSNKIPLSQQRFFDTNLENIRKEVIRKKETIANLYRYYNIHTKRSYTSI